MAVGLVQGCASDDAQSCSCDVTIGGMHAVIACGASDCVAGHTQACDRNANVTEGGTCGGSSTFDCNGETCQTATQYCLATYTGTVQTTSACTTLPPSCTSCGCAQADAPTHFPMANNCSSGVTLTCINNNNEISIRCER